MAAQNDSTQFNQMTSPYMESFTSVSGSDITGAFGPVEMSNLLGINVSVNREVNPIYVLGQEDAASFVKGRRGVAGSFMAVCHDRGAMYDIIERHGVYAQRKNQRPVTAAMRRENFNQRLEGNFLSETERLGYVLKKPDYPDQLPPFDATLVGQSESMAATVSRVGGISVVSMGTGVSVDENSIEQQMTFVALFFENWRPAGRRNFQDYDQPADRGRNVSPFDPGMQGEDFPAYPEQSPSDDQLGQDFGLNPDFDEPVETTSA